MSESDSVCAMAAIPPTSDPPSNVAPLGITKSRADRLNLTEKLSSPSYAAHTLVKTLPGRELTVSYLQREGFEKPLHVAERQELDLRLPKVLGMSDIRTAVGSRRPLEVIDCSDSNNKTVTMTMKDFQRYFDTPRQERTAVLNVISLEFSNTKLDSQVLTPKIVRMVDWIDRAWPKHLKELQIEPTNNVDDMMYPKVSFRLISHVRNGLKCICVIAGAEVLHHVSGEVLHGLSHRLRWSICLVREHFLKVSDFR